MGSESSRSCGQIWWPYSQGRDQNKKEKWPQLQYLPYALIFKFGASKRTTLTSEIPRKLPLVNVSVYLCNGAENRQHQTTIGCLFLYHNKDMRWKTFIEEMKIHNSVFGVSFHYNNFCLMSISRCQALHTLFILIIVKLYLNSLF